MSAIAKKMIPIQAAFAGMSTRKIILWALAIFALSCLIAVITLPVQTDSAQAIAWVPIIAVGAAIVGAIGIGVAGEDAITEAAEAIISMLREGCNMCLGLMATLVEYTVEASSLTSTFSTLIESSYPFIVLWHKAIFVPMGYTVMCVLLVFALIKIFTEAGQHEASVDVTKITMTFILFAVGYNVVSFSMEIMVAIYSLITEMTAAILTSGITSLAYSYNYVDSDVTNLGTLLMMFLSVVVCFLITLGVFIVSRCVLIVRAIQILIMTGISPIPLACTISETARPIATGFLKKYIAVVAAGAIMAMLLVMFGAVIIETAGTTVSPDSAQAIFQWVLEIITSMVFLVAFAYCMIKSGSWSRDWIGV